jgi:tetratricopeptide (TPR) repeat protein
VQANIASEIAAAVLGRTIVETTEQLALGGTRSGAALLSYLKARAEWNRRTVQSLQSARVFFREATHEDPAFGLAYVGLADVHALLPTYSSCAYVPDEMAAATTAVKRALAIEERLAEGHATLGHILAHNYEWDRSLEAFRRALDLNPRYGRTHHWYALTLWALGRLEDALDHLEQAVILDGVSPMASTLHATVLVVSGNRAAGVGRLRDTIARFPQFAEARRMLARALALEGRFRIALSELREARALMFGGTGRHLSIADGDTGWIYARAGHLRKAESILADLLHRARSRDPGRCVTAHEVALVYMGLRKIDEAFEWLGRSVAAREVPVRMLKTDLRFEGLRTEDRFGELLVRMGLPPSN